MEGIKGLSERICPSVTAQDWIEEAHLFKEMFQFAQVGSEEQNTFVFLLSNRWIEAWKDKVNFSILEEGMELTPQHIKMEVELPTINQDLIDPTFQEHTEEYEFLKCKDDNYQLFNVVIKPDVTEYIDYTLIREDAWKVLKIKFPDAIELKRVKSTDPFTYQSIVEVKFPLVNPSLLRSNATLFPNPSLD